MIIHSISILFFLFSRTLFRTDFFRMNSFWIDFEKFDSQHADYSACKWCWFFKRWTIFACSWQSLTDWNLTGFDPFSWLRSCLPKSLAISHKQTSQRSPLKNPKCCPVSLGSIDCHDLIMKTILFLPLISSSENIRTDKGSSRRGDNSEVSTPQNVSGWDMTDIYWQRPRVRSA